MVVEHLQTGMYVRAEWIYLDPENNHFLDSVMFFWAVLIGGMVQTMSILVHMHGCV